MNNKTDNKKRVEEKKQDNSGWTAVFTLRARVLASFQHCFSRQGRTETCARNRGRKNVSDQFPNRPLLLFFPFLSTTMNLSNPRRNAERPPGLIERLAAFPYFISRQGSRSRIFIADRAKRVSLLSRISTTRSSNISRLFSLSARV